MSRLGSWATPLGNSISGCGTGAGNSIILPASSVPPHACAVQKDVVRSLWRIVLPADLAQRRRQLSRLLNWALATDPALHYYQGLWRGEV